MVLKVLYMVRLGRFASLLYFFVASFLMVLFFEKKLTGTIEQHSVLP